MLLQVRFGRENRKSSEVYRVFSAATLFKFELSLFDKHFVFFKKDIFKKKDVNKNNIFKLNIYNFFL